MRQHLKKQNGAAAIFIVVFFALLITVIALSFLRIAMQDQQQSTDNDLSQSAYDSADAGLEDAKRALSWYRVNCPPNRPALAGQDANCNDYNTQFTGVNRCNLANLPEATLPGTKRVLGTSEVKVSTASGNKDDKLDQAYTCVTITTDTEDYKGDTSSGKSDTLIPLKTVGNSQIDKIELNWFSNRGDNDITPNYLSPGVLPVPNAANWSQNTPPIIRLQLITVLRGAITISDVDNDAKTVFLFPASSGANTVSMITADTGRTSQKDFAPHAVKCKNPIQPGVYACSVQLDGLPTASNGGNPSNTDYYLRLTPIYNNTNYQVRLLGDGGATIRLFNNVEPEVDSTGRANNVFRRVQSRVRDLSPVTDGGMDITKGVCKDFHVPSYSTNCSPSELVEP